MGHREVRAVEERTAMVSRIFADIIQTSHRMEYIVDRELRKDGLTAREWQVIAAIELLFSSPPAIKDVAEAISTSHQNVRRIADQLVRKGFMAIERDPEDGRVLRLLLTERNREYWASREGRHGAMTADLFSDMSNSDLEALMVPLGKLAEQVERRYGAERHG
jgi:DNA-binding MarR family transcriptional regulator